MVQFLAVGWNIESVHLPDEVVNLWIFTIGLTSSGCQPHMSSIWPWSGMPKVRLYDTFLGGLRHCQARTCIHLQRHPQHIRYLRLCGRGLLVAAEVSLHHHDKKDKNCWFCSLSPHNIMQQVRIPPANQGCSTIYRDPPNMPATFDCVWGAHRCWQRLVCHNYKNWWFVWQRWRQQQWQCCRCRRQGGQRVSMP